MRIAYVMLSVAAIAALVLVSQVSAQSETEVKPGKIGDKAFPVTTNKWIQGKKFDPAKPDGKHIYLVEFWATWCGPCRVSIPHLNGLYEKYKDRGVKIVGLTDEDADMVKAFVKGQGDQMTYPVAIDENDKAFDQYFGAFGLDGIPHVFVIDKKGKIAWHGHPMDPVLEQKVEEMAPKPAPEEGNRGNVHEGSSREES